MEPSRVRKASNTVPFIALIIISIGGGLGFYYWLSYSSANSFNLDLLDFTLEYRPLQNKIYIDIEVEVSHGGKIEAVLSNIELTLFIHNHEVGEIQVESLERFSAISSKTYQGSYNVLLLEDIDITLFIVNYAQTNSIDIKIKMEAISKSGFYSGYIEKVHSETWTNE